MKNIDGRDHHSIRVLLLCLTALDRSYSTMPMGIGAIVPKLREDAWVVRTAVLKDGPTCANYLRMQEAPIETRFI
jgi:hypothetical protein